MIQTEAMIWAAVFAKHWDITKMPHFEDVDGPYRQQRREWMKKHTQQCCDFATQAIDALRTFKEEALVEYGEIPAAAHIAQMVGNAK